MFMFLLVYIPDLPDIAKSLMTLPLFIGMPIDEVQSMTWMGSMQTLFYYTDQWMYNDIVKPYIPLYTDLLTKAPQSYRGPNNIYWADLPWAKPTIDELRGNELHADYGVFDRRARRYGEKIGEPDPEIEKLRSRKTATNVWVTAQNELVVKIMYSHDAIRPLAALEALFDPANRGATDQFAFDADLVGEGTVTFIRLDLPSIY